MLPLPALLLPRGLSPLGPLGNQPVLGLVRGIFLWVTLMRPWSPLAQLLPVFEQVKVMLKFAVTVFKLFPEIAPRQSSSRA